MPIIPAAAAGQPHGAIVPIGRYVADGTSGAATFLSIPQIYQDLLVVCKARTSFTGMYTGVSGYINSGGTTSMSETFWTTTNSGSNGLRQLTTTPNYGPQALYGAAASYSPPNIFAQTEFHYFNYTSTTTHKTILVQSGLITSYAANGSIELNVANYGNVSAPITRLDISTNGNFVVGSIISLYGVRAYNQ
jgi:hypothetical protein